MKTTLKEIWSKRPRKSGWDTLVDGLGMSELKDLAKDDEAPDIEVSLRFILENNGWEDCQFAWTCVDGYDRELRLLAVEFARPVKHLMTEPSLHALDVAKRFADGLATADELYVSRFEAEQALTREPSQKKDAQYAAFYCAHRNVGCSAKMASFYAAYYATYAIKSQKENAIKNQIAEFKRLLDCIESGERYEI